MGLIGKYKFLYILTIFLIVLAIYAQTFREMFLIWWEYEAYQHCILVIPISLYLIYVRSGNLHFSLSKADYLGALLLLFSVFGYMLGDYLQLSLLQHISVLLSIPFLIWSLYGLEVYKQLIFPLTFMLFAVPFGGELIPLLIDITADGVISLLQSSGFPVYREGAVFIVPSGAFEVEAACSGVNYLLSSMTTGALIAYLMLCTNRMRLFFFLISILLPVGANIIRAYLIVIIANYSNNEYATGVDHIIGGWVFFGFVVALLLYIASIMGRWERSISEVRTKSSSKEAQAKLDKLPCAGFARRSLVAFLILFTPNIWAESKLKSVYSSVGSVEFQVEIERDCEGLFFRSSAKILDPEVCREFGEEEVYWRIFQVENRPYAETSRLLDPMFSLSERAKQLTIRRVKQPVSYGGNQATIYESRHEVNGENALVWRWAVLSSGRAVTGYDYSVSVVKQKLVSPNKPLRYVTLVTSAEEDNAARARLLRAWESQSHSSD